MFNDRPGFRNSSTIIWRPWNTENNFPHKIYCNPTILMDSHLYDYNSFSSLERIAQIKNWVQECKFVGGSAAVLWHPHTLAKDYNWGNGFHEILEEIKQDK